MFWGKGDSSKLDEETTQTLAHLRRMEETGHIVALTHEQTQVALRAVIFYGQWESVLRFFTSVKNVALLVGALLGTYWVSEGWIVDRIRQLLTRSP